MVCIALPLQLTHSNQQLGTEAKQNQRTAWKAYATYQNFEYHAFSDVIMSKIKLPTIAIFWPSCPTLQSHFL